jgi:hypothetical protein
MEKKTMGLYTKLALIQGTIKVSKTHYNDFSNYNFRDLNDILREVKPKLQELGLLMYFSGCSIVEKTLKTSLIIIDVETSEKMEIPGEIIIDFTKKKMDDSQKCLSAFTFLKKNLLEDILLISEDVDPDYLNNEEPQKQPQKQPQKSQPKQKTPRKINNQQRALIYAKCKDANISNEDLHITIEKLFKIKSVNDLTIVMLNTLIKRIEKAIMKKQTA